MQSFNKPIDSSSAMYSIWTVHAAVLLHTSLQMLVSASLDRVEDIPEVSVNNIVDYVTLPWMEARDWLLHCSKSLRAREVRTFVRGVESGETWALEMLDALWEIQEEILQRNIQVMGTNDQSIMVNAQHDHINIRKRSCEIMSPGILATISGRSSSSCVSLSIFDALSKDKPQVTQIVKNAAQGIPQTSESDLGASGSLFLPSQLKDLATVEIATILFILTIGAFMIGCTICDIVRRINHRGEFPAALIMLSKFSLYTNALAILSTEVTPDMMPAIHGIRFLSCCHVILGHRYFISILALGKSITLLDFLKEKNSWIAVYIVMAPYAVDTFFVIGGFLTAYLFFKSMKSGRKYNLLMTYLHRYVRITPCLVIVMLFATVLLHRAGSGPLWVDMVTRLNNQCRESWWIHFLYAQNFVKNGILCLPHCWYLATDMQLFCISPVILYPLHKWPRIGLGVLSLCLVASVVTPAIILAINGYWHTILRFDVGLSRIIENLLNYYMATYNHACPYLVGILLGYEEAKKKRHLTQINVAINWLIAISLILFCIWATNWAYNLNFAYDLRMEIAFAALLRSSWSIAMAWIIYACTQGHGGLATRFLTVPLFFPLSRLAYCVYLVHTGIQAIAIIPLQTSESCFGFRMFYRICGDLVLSIALAFIFSLFIESPAIVLVKILTNTACQPEQATVVQEPKKTKRLQFKANHPSD